jgi:hypothetical protein
MTPLFEERVQALPAELFNDIFDLVFTLPYPNEVVIDKSYRPPVQLQISQALRNEISKTYYRKTKFTASDLQTLVPWLLSLTRSSRRMLRTVSVAVNWWPLEDDYFRWDEQCEIGNADWYLRFHNKFVQLGVHHQVVSRRLRKGKWELSQAAQMREKAIEMLKWFLQPNLDGGSADGWDSDDEWAAKTGKLCIESGSTIGGFGTTVKICGGLIPTMRSRMMMMEEVVPKMDLSADEIALTSHPAFGR